MFPFILNTSISLPWQSVVLGQLCFFVSMTQVDQEWLNDYVYLLWYELVQNLDHGARSAVPYTTY